MWYTTFLYKTKHPLKKRDYFQIEDETYEDNIEVIVTELVYSFITRGDKVWEVIQDLTTLVKKLIKLF